MSIHGVRVHGPWKLSGTFVVAGPFDLLCRAFIHTWNCRQRHCQFHLHTSEASTEATGDFWSESTDGFHTYNATMAAETDISQLTDSQQEALQMYTSVTDQEPIAEIALLQRSDWNVQVRFFPRASSCKY